MLAAGTMHRFPIMKKSISENVNFCNPFFQIGRMKKMIIGVMGPGTGAKAQDLENAYELGRLIAERGWVLLTGGKNVGVMDAASRGAKAANGLTIGILPSSDKTGISPAIDIPIITDLGDRANFGMLDSRSGPWLNLYLHKLLRQPLRTIGSF